MSKRTYVPRRPCLYVPFQKTLSFAPGWRVQGGVGGVAHLLAFGKRLTLTSPFPFPHPLWFRIRNVSKMVSCATSLIVPSCGGLGMSDYYPSLLDISNSWDQIT